MIDIKITKTGISKIEYDLKRKRQNLHGKALRSAAMAVRDFWRSRLLTSRDIHGRPFKKLKHRDGRPLYDLGGIYHAIVAKKNAKGWQAQVMSVPEYPKGRTTLKLAHWHQSGVPSRNIPSRKFFFRDRPDERPSKNFMSKLDKIVRDAIG